MIALQVAAQPLPPYFEKHLVFPAGSSLDDKVALAARLVPSKQQLAWQEMELSAFLHFGINTFTDREWGDGSEDPALFNPTDFDADQWIRTLRNAGFRMVILTAKHHDGFCLWPTHTTSHSVASSPWRGGRGDVVREVRDACERYGMKFGVYLSPWDRNAECYGDSPAYNRFFIEQLTELLTNYGEVHEVWFDGANGEGPNGKKQVYDWNAFYETIHRLQPGALTAIMGDDVRWVGNEKGLGRETEWSATVLTPGVYERAQTNNEQIGIGGMAEDLGSRSMLERADELFWYPSEVDVSIRPGWFYHASQNNEVKSLKQLVDIYFQSVGYNSVLLLNVPPDTRGHIHEADSVRLQEWARYLRQTFANDRVVGGSKAWEAGIGAERKYKLAADSPINVVMLQEEIGRGQHIEAFTVDAQTDEGWQTLCSGTTVGHKRLLRFPATRASVLRIRIDSTRAKAHISRIGAFYAQPLAEEFAQTFRNDIPRSTWSIVEPDPLTIDFGAPTMLAGFTYAPTDALAHPKMAFRYRFEVSEDGKRWKTEVGTGEFSNIVNNPLPQTVAFDSPVIVRFVRIAATSPEGEVAHIEPTEMGFSSVRQE